MVHNTWRKLNIYILHNTYKDGDWVYRWMFFCTGSLKEMLNKEPLNGLLLLFHRECIQNIDVIRLSACITWNIIGNHMHHWLILQDWLIDMQYTPCPEKGATIFVPLTLPNMDRFSKFFHEQTVQYICNKAIISHHSSNMSLYYLVKN